MKQRILKVMSFLLVCVMCVGTFAIKAEAGLTGDFAQMHIEWYLKEAHFSLGEGYLNGAAFQSLDSTGKPSSTLYVYEPELDASTGYYVLKVMTVGAESSETDPWSGDIEIIPNEGYEYDHFEYRIGETGPYSELKFDTNIEDGIFKGKCAKIINADDQVYFLPIFVSDEPAPDPAPNPDKEYYIDPLVRELENKALNGSTDTAYWDKGDGLNNRVMKLLFENPALSVDFTFVYEGVEHEVFIGPGQAVNDDTPWYGPLWLIEKYGDKKAVKHGEYTVVKDDTLNAIAKKFDTTVDELMKLNTFIKDSHWIYPNQVMKY